MNKDFLIALMTSTLMERLEYFVNLEDYATSDAIYEEFVVNDVDPEEEQNYEWIFVGV